MPDGVIKLVAGLGNPGMQYARSRHNIGFQVVEVLAERLGMRFDRVQKRARLAQGDIKIGAGWQGRLLVARPLTFMNASGESVGPLRSFYKIALPDVLVVCDDLDLPVGRLRLRAGGSSGGQKGIQSIINHFGSQEFARLRVGIGRPPGQMDPADYVLRPFAAVEEEEIQLTRTHAVDAIETWLGEGIEAAMNRHNGMA